MVRALKILGAAVVAALLLTACSSDSGTATATVASTAAPGTSSVATITATSSPNASSTSSAASTSTLSTSGSSNGTAAPVVFDDASKKWFDAFCTGLGGFAAATIGAAASQANSTGQIPGDQKLAAQSALYSTISKASSDLSTSLGAIPPPGYEGGAQSAGSFVSALQTLSSAYDKASKDVAAGDPANADAVIEQADADVQATGTGINQAVGDIDSLFPKNIQAAAQQQVPSCAILAAVGSNADSGSTATTT